MARMTVKCPKCEYKESIISTSMSAEMPPCPRCEDFIRMDDVTPPPGQQTVISTAGSKAAEVTTPPQVRTVPEPVAKTRDMRDFGPEPRN